MPAYPLLFGLEVVHDYFADPSRCQLDFLPDPASAAWLAKAGCLLRASPNGLKVYQEAGPGGRWPSGGAILRFEVRPRDPEFALYTARLDPLPNLHAPAGDAPATIGPGPVFDTASAIRDPSDGAWVMRRPAAPGPFTASQPQGAPPGQDIRSGFQLLVRLPAEPSPAPPLFRMVLGRRAVVWKYLLTGDWSEGQPYIKAAEAASWALAASPPTGASPISSPPASSPPASDRDLSFERLAEEALLADGRKAIAFRSNKAIPLSERASQRLELWAGAGAGAGADADRMLIKALPTADPRNLALEDPTDPSTLVCEIYVSR